VRAGGRIPLLDRAVQAHADKVDTAWAAASELFLRPSAAAETGKASPWRQKMVGQGLRPERRAARHQL